jgi:hypothetical protein
LVLHVQAFPNGNSASFINNPAPPTIVPEPSSVSLILIGFAILGGFTFYRRKKNSQIA